MSEYARLFTKLKIRATRCDPKKTPMSTSSAASERLDAGAPMEHCPRHDRDPTPPTLTFIRAPLRRVTCVAPCEARRS